ncbi:MAG: SRPBCC family protein [Thermodesulfobacteriota bacterium]
MATQRAGHDRGPGDGQHAGVGLAAQPPGGRVDVGWPRGGFNEERLARALGWFSIGLGLAEVAAPRSLARLIGVSDHRALLRVLGLREIASGLGILTTRRRPAGWLWARVGGDVVDLALLGAALESGNTRRGRVTAAAAAVAGVTVVDLLCSQGLSRSPGVMRPIAAEYATSITVGKSADELYRFWREPQSLSRIMGHFAEVTAAGAGRTHWVVRAPLGQSLEWDAQVVEDRPGELLRWESLAGAQLPTAGAVHFRPAPGDRGTEVTLRFRFDPPGGALGDAAVKLLGPAPGMLAGRALRCFKSLAETGEVPTTEHNPSARAGADAD